MTPHRLNHYGVVIVGGGLAGQRCAETLRRAGYDGPIRMVCAERHAPYDRPPLSKELLASSSEQPAPSFRAPEWYTEQSIDLLLGVSATCLDLAQKRVDLSDGTSLPFGQPPATPASAGGLPQRIHASDDR